MWLLLAALVGLTVYSTTRQGSTRGGRFERRHGRLGTYVRRGSLAPPPGPLMVLAELMQRQIYPPPFLVMCALAEAQALGRLDVANDIVMTFIAPVVHQYDLQHARSVALGPDAPGAPQASVPDGPPGLGPDGIFRENFRVAPMPPWAVDKMNREGAYAPQPPPTPGSDPLNFDPLNMMADIARGAAARPPAPMIEVDPRTVNERVEPNTDQHGAIQDGPIISGAIDMTKLESPIAGVNALDWSRFCDLLVREAPTFSSGRHVGQYRQNKDRLAELGIRPETLVGRPDLQQRALDRDLADAYHHVRASGMLRHVGRSIALPGVAEQARITLSGLLGVIQAAGLDGAIGWLEKPGDRKRFKHTTQAFTRTNGAF